MLNTWDFLSPWLYNKVYVIIISILTIICIVRYNSMMPGEMNRTGSNISNLFALILCILTILFLGLRPISGAFIDMINYTEQYRMISGSGVSNNENSNNYLFSLLFDFIAQNSFDIVLLFLIMACIYIGCLWVTLKGIFHEDLFYAFIIYLGAFSTFSYGTNGIKAGAAASIFLLVFLFYRNPLLAAFFCFLSLGFHHSMIIVIIAFSLSYFIKNPKWYFGGWLICLLIGLLHISYFQSLFAGFLEDESATRYLLGNQNDWGGKAGFRWDMILYSFPPIALAWWYTYKWKVKDRRYQLLFCTYLTTNALWMLCMYMPYNNRLAYLSWFLLPILICYPFFKFNISRKQYFSLNWIVTVYLLFTITTTFMP